jgi:hypothetical protein
MSHFYLNSDKNNTLIKLIKAFISDGNQSYNINSKIHLYVNKLNNSFNKIYFINENYKYNKKVFYFNNDIYPSWFSERDRQEVKRSIFIKTGVICRKKKNSENFKCIYRCPDGVYWGTNLIENKNYNRKKKEFKDDIEKEMKDNKLIIFDSLFDFNNYVYNYFTDLNTDFDIKILYK